MDLGNREKGVFRSKRYCLDSASRTGHKKDSPLFFHGRIAPSFKESDEFGTTRSGSKKGFVPNPLQVGQAPWGLLKENIRGVISAKLNPQWIQENFWLKTTGETPSLSTLTIPSDKREAISSDSPTLCSMPSFPPNRSPYTRISRA